MQVPEFTLAAEAEPPVFRAPQPCDCAMPVPRAEAVLREAQPESACVLLAAGRPAVLPRFALELADTDFFDVVPIPPPWQACAPGQPAEAVERELPAAATPEPLPDPTTLELPKGPTCAAGVLCPQREEELVAPPPAVPAEMPVETRWDGAITDAPPPAPVIELPALPDVGPAAQPPLAMPQEPRGEQPVLPVRDPLPLEAPSVVHALRLPRAAELLPNAGGIGVATPAGYAQPPMNCGATPEAAAADISTGVPAVLRLPDSAALGVVELSPKPLGTQLSPQPLESLPACVRFSPVPLTAALEIFQPLFEPWEEPILAAAGFADRRPGPAAPAPKQPDGKVAVLRPVCSIQVRVPPPDSAWPQGNIPRPGLIPVDYHCQRAAATPSRRIQWQTRDVPLAPPGFEFALAAERPEDAAALKPITKAPIAKVQPIPEAHKRRRDSRTMIRVAQIAAGLVLTAGVWIGTRAITGEDMAAPESRSLSVTEPAATSAAATAPVVPQPPALKPPDPPPNTTMGRLRRVIANRAAAEMTDNFRTGMESWGEAAGTWAPGWAHHPDGYTRTGDLALFRPSSSFTNYRLEFFGQIETRGMGWVVRAQDGKNYYAMKFRMVEAGLRPVIAMVRYPVVEGRKGRSVETPLNVMVHRDLPFRVAVDVRGSRLTASVDGQEIGSWTDRLMAKGGVGFFSEAGERARLYWMKVSKNQDWLGQVCAFIAGSGPAQTAELCRPGIPAGGAPPAPPGWLPDVALAESETGRVTSDSPHRVRISNLGRIYPWSC